MKLVTASLLAVVSFVAQYAHAATVWNVNVGWSALVSGPYEITTSDNYVGAATENTSNSTWNAVSSVGPVTLADSTGDSGAGITLTITPAGGSAIDFGGTGITSGDEIFETWIKDNGNNDLFTVTFGNLSSAANYDLVVYSEWFWDNGDGGQPITQTAGTGLAGTFFLNRLIDGTNEGDVEPLSQDTDPANVNGVFNYARFNGLSSDGSNNLSFSMGAVNGPINGFQLIENVAIPEPSSALMLGLAGLLLARRSR